MTMHTRCPHCHTVFRIRDDQLEVAGGQVRCGLCNGRFDAHRHLQAALPFEGDTRGQSELDLPGPPKTVQQAADPWFIDEERASDDGIRHSWTRILAWGGINALLLVALIGQLLFVQRAVFAQDPTLRPLLVQVCELAGCELPARRAIGELELTRRNVYSHPNVSNALIIEAEFVNNADFAQPYPTLTVTLGDLRGRPRIRRHFEPAEYLDNAAGGERDMLPGAPAHILLEVRDPGRDARTFELDFS